MTLYVITLVPSPALLMLLMLPPHAPDVVVGTCKHASGMLRTCSDNVGHFDAVWDRGSMVAVNVRDRKRFGHMHVMQIAIGMNWSVNYSFHLLSCALVECTVLTAAILLSSLYVRSLESYAHLSAALTGYLLLFLTHCSGMWTSSSPSLYQREPS